MSSITIDSKTLQAAEELPRRRIEAAELESAQRAAAQRATTEVESLTNRLTRGDTTVAAGDLVLARAEAERAGLLCDFAIREAKKLRLSNVPTSFEVASRAAEILHVAGLVEAPVTIASSVLSAPKRSGLPGLHLTQRRHVANENITDASFTLVLYSNSKHYTLPSPEVIRKAFAAYHWEVGATLEGPEEVSPGVWVQRANLDCTVAFSAAPAIPGGNVIALHNGLPGWAGERMGVQPVGPSQVQASRLGAERDGDLVTERWAVAASIGFQLGTTGSEAAIRGALEGLQFRYLPGMGVVSEVAEVGGASTLPGGVEVTSEPHRTPLPEPVLAMGTPYSRSAMYAVITTQRTEPPAPAEDADDDYDDYDA